MALRTLPLLYINMGGEMLYILEQRLTAQKVQGFKCVKVLEDVSRVMVHKSFVEELFLRPEKLDKHGIVDASILRLIFDKVAHASIMRLDKHSMDKLYDLMLMATKYQVVMSRDPMDLIMITLNHLDAIMDYAAAVDRDDVAFVYELLVQTYCVLNPATLQSVRYAMLNQLQDARVKVSLFLNQKKQSPQDGRFLFGPIAYHIRGASRPGQIRHYSETTLESTTDFDVGIVFDEEIQVAKKNAGLALQNQTGNRGTKLGLNMYADEGSRCMDPSASAIVNRRDSLASSSISKDTTKLAREELDLIAKIINNQQVNTKDKFKLNFLQQTNDPTEDGESRDTEKAGLEEECIALSRDSAALEEIMGEMKMADDQDQSAEPLDLLALMDKETL